MATLSVLHRWQLHVKSTTMQMERVLLFHGKRFYVLYVILTLPALFVTGFVVTKSFPSTTDK